MNIRRLKKVRRKILEAHEQFNYMFYDCGVRSLKQLRTNEISIAECRTIGCVVGYTNLMFDRERYFMYGGIYDRAKDQLDLTDEQALFLFIPWRYNTETHFNYQNHNYMEAIRRLSWLIERKPLKDYH